MRNDLGGQLGALPESALAANDTFTLQMSEIASNRVMTVGNLDCVAHQYQRREEQDAGSSAFNTVTSAARQRFAPDGASLGVSELEVPA